MSQDVTGDKLVVIKIEGMHCHSCEKALRKSLLANPGVHEVEIDLHTGQASVLYDPKAVRIRQLVDSITAAGYRAAGFAARPAP